MFPQATEEAAAHSRSQIIQLAPPSALRRAGVTGNHASNRFFSFATDSDDDQTIVERVPTRPRRRLHLRWNSDDAQQVPVTQIDTPDSCDQRLARVRHAVQQERVVSHVRHDVRGAVKGKTSREQSEGNSGPHSTCQLCGPPQQGTRMPFFMVDECWATYRVYICGRHHHEWSRCCVGWLGDIVRSHARICPSGSTDKVSQGHNVGCPSQWTCPRADPHNGRHSCAFKWRCWRVGKCHCQWNRTCRNCSSFVSLCCRVAHTTCEGGSNKPIVASWKFATRR